MVLAARADYEQHSTDHEGTNKHQPSDAPRAPLAGETRKLLVGGEIAQDLLPGGSTGTGRGPPLCERQPSNTTRATIPINNPAPTETATPKTVAREAAPSKAMIGPAQHAAQATAPNPMRLALSFRFTSSTVMGAENDSIRPWSPP